MKVLMAIGGVVCTGMLMAMEPLLSPDGTLKVTVNGEEAPAWSLARKGVDLVLPSRLGLDFIGQKPWRGFRVRDVKRRSLDAPWTTRLYKQEPVRDHANELDMALDHAEGRRMTLVFRAYNEGVAFRYVIPEQDGFDGFQLRGEPTEWRFPEGVDGWFTSYGNWVSSQECDFRNRKIAEIGAKELIGMPAIVNVGGQRVALCEADLTNWAGIYYRVPAKGQKPGAATLEAALTPLPRSNACAPDVAVIRMAPAASPWRVMICAGSGLDLLSRNDIISNLNPPPGPSLAFSWVVPGA